MRRNIFKKIIYGLIDLIVSYGLSLLVFRYALTFDELSQNQFIGSLIYSAVFAALLVLIFAIFKIYDIISSNFSIGDAFKISVMTTVLEVVGLLVIIIVPNKYLYFQTGMIISWLLTSISLIFLLNFIRLSNRLLLLFKKRMKHEKGVITAIIGAGAAAKIVLEDSRYNLANNHDVVVLIDDDINKIGGVFSNIPVKGPISNINTIIDFYKVEEVIIAIADLSESRYREILDILSSCNVRVRRMPLLSEMNGPNDTRIIDVDLDDLLSREPVKLDNHEVLQMLNNKTVMVTGAGGSIGSELVRQIFNTHPSTLILFDIYENSTYDIQQELVRKMRNENINDINLITLIGSTYNEVRMEQIIKKYKPDYIYHAAAYKHVPLMEDSPMEAIRTNVIGTYNVAKLADKYKVKKMVLVSTDKAVRPTNVMGATKRFAETIIQYFSEKSKNTAYAAVRFGNVLGSNGSVVPLFKKQIEEGGPVTITDKRIIRYFMTIPEAVSLILQCGLYANGGEIFILDMGKPVKILSLAEKLIRQSGKIPNVDIEIVETGLRPGEKLYEELLLDVDNQIKTAHKRIYIEQKEDIKPIEEEIQEISKVFELDNNEDIKKLLGSIITTYHSESNK